MSGIALPLLGIAAGAMLLGGFQSATKGEMYMQAALQTEKIFLLQQNLKEVVETFARFATYATEVQTMEELGFSFQDWCQLTLLKPNVENSELIYLVPSSYTNKPPQPNWVFYNRL